MKTNNNPNQLVKDLLLKEALEACREFCAKVEDGKARSVQSYNRMKAIINNYDKQGSDEI